MLIFFNLLFLVLGPSSVLFAAGNFVDVFWDEYRDYTPSLVASSDAEDASYQLFFDPKQSPKIPDSNHDVPLPVFVNKKLKEWGIEQHKFSKEELAQKSESFRMGLDSIISGINGVLPKLKAESRDVGSLIVRAFVRYWHFEETCLTGHGWNSSAIAEQDQNTSALRFLTFMENLNNAVVHATQFLAQHKKSLPDFMIIRRQIDDLNSLMELNQFSAIDSHLAELRFLARNDMLQTYNNRLATSRSTSSESISKQLAVTPLARNSAEVPRTPKKTFAAYSATLRAEFIRKTVEFQSHERFFKLFLRELESTQNLLSGDKNFQLTNFKNHLQKIQDGNKALMKGLQGHFYQRTGKLFTLRHYTIFWRKPESKFPIPYGVEDATERQYMWPKFEEEDLVSLLAFLEFERGVKSFLDAYHVRLEKEAPLSSVFNSAMDAFCEEKKALGDNVCKLPAHPIKALYQYPASWISLGVRTFRFFRYACKTLMDEYPDRVSLDDLCQENSKFTARMEKLSPQLFNENLGDVLSTPEMVPPIPSQFVWKTRASRNAPLRLIALRNVSGL